MLREWRSNEGRAYEQLYLRFFFHFILAVCIQFEFLFLLKISIIFANQVSEQRDMYYLSFWCSRLAYRNLKYFLKTWHFLVKKNKYEIIFNPIWNEEKLDIRAFYLHLQCLDSWKNEIFKVTVGQNNLKIVMQRSKFIF